MSSDKNAKKPKKDYIETAWEESEKFIAIQIYSGNKRIQKLNLWLKIPLEELASPSFNLTSFKSRLLNELKIEIEKTIERHSKKHEFSEKTKSKNKDQKLKDVLAYLQQRLPTLKVEDILLFGHVGGGKKVPANTKADFQKNLPAQAEYAKVEYRFWVDFSNGTLDPDTKASAASYILQINKIEPKIDIKKKQKHLFYSKSSESKAVTQQKNKQVKNKGNLIDNDESTSEDTSISSEDTSISSEDEAESLTKNGEAKFEDLPRREHRRCQIL